MQSDKLLHTPFLLALWPPPDYTQGFEALRLVPPGKGFSALLP